MASIEMVDVCGEVAVDGHVVAKCVSIPRRSWDAGSFVAEGAVKAVRDAVAYAASRTGTGARIDPAAVTVMEPSFYTVDLGGDE